MPKSAQNKNLRKIPDCLILFKVVRVKWSDCGISSTDSKVSTALHVSIIDSGCDRVNPLSPNIKIQILLSCPHTVRIEVVGRSC